MEHKLEAVLGDIAKECRAMTVLTGHTREDEEEMEVQRVIARDTVRSCSFVELSHSVHGLHKLFRPLRQHSIKEVEQLCAQHGISFYPEVEKSGNGIGLLGFQEYDQLMLRKWEGIMEECMAFNPTIGVAYVRVNSQNRLHGTTWLHEPFLAHHILGKLISWVNSSSSQVSPTYTEVFRRWILDYVPSTMYQVKAQNGVSLCPPVSRIGTDVWTIARQPFFSKAKQLTMPLGTEWSMWDKRFMLRATHEPKRPLFVRPLLASDVKTLFQRRPVPLRTLKLYWRNSPEPVRETLPCVVDELGNVQCIPSLGIRIDRSVSVDCYFYEIPEQFEEVPLDSIKAK
jgi:hypothetical protein